MHNFKLAWKLKTDPTFGEFRYFETPALNADRARQTFANWLAEIGITQGEIRIIYVSLA